MRDDDAFWAARRVMAFSDDLIRAIVKTGRFSDTRAEQQLGDVLIKRRDRIGRTYLTRLNPIVDPALDASGTLTFGNAAVEHRLRRPPAGVPRRMVHLRQRHRANAADRRDERRTLTAAGAGRPARLSLAAYIQVEISANHPTHPSWKQPVRVFFRRQAAGWKLVGLRGCPGPVTRAGPDG